MAAWRADIHRTWLEGDPPPEDCGHHAVVIGGVDCLRGRDPERAGTGRSTVVYFHGGGYVLGSPAVSVPITEGLLPHADVVSVDYRLAPAHPYPSAIEDGLSVYGELAATVDGPLLLAGDSAGANIALSVAIGVLATGGPAPAGLVLLSPHLGPRSAKWEDSSAEAAADPVSDVDAAAGRWLWDAYRGARPADDPQLSPLAADLTGLPPIMVQVGTRDQGRTDARRLVERAAEFGVDIALDLWPGMWHTWQYHRDLPEAAGALHRVGIFIDGLCD